MRPLAERIYEIVQDYHCDEQAGISIDSILEWVNQFDEGDREFVLQEFLHLLGNGIYISKTKAKEYLWTNLVNTAKILGYKDDVVKFISETEFFKAQAEGKSQTILLQILNNLTVERLGVGINPDSDAKNYIYIDDIIATGKTVLNWFSKWLGDEENLKKIISKEKRILTSVFCHHEHAVSNIKWILKQELKNDRIMDLFHVVSNYAIQDNSRFPSSSLNYVFPLESDSKIAMKFLSEVGNDGCKRAAFRLDGRPGKEVFFSSPDNRRRFESIFLGKGMEILDKVAKRNDAHRPLGATYPSHKTLGLGTLFFTWRNISNTCPLVLWWSNDLHGWRGLFPLSGRGR